MEKIIITSGSKYTDIDVLACAVPLVTFKTFLYKKLNKDVLIEAVLPGPLNNTISKSLLNLNIYYKKQVPFDLKDTKYIIVDVSDPSYICDFVNNDQIIELFDHHFGFEEYWKEKLGDESHIEQIGSCATQIYEVIRDYARGENLSILDIISRDHLLLLYTAIFSNTLCLKASVTMQRDIDAFHEIEKLIEIPNGWVTLYYKETEEELFKNPKVALENDRKELNLDSNFFSIGQMELWDSKKFLENYKSEIYEVLKTTDLWFLTSPSISEGKNYLITDNTRMQQILTEAINAKFEGDRGVTEKVFMRKEILREIKRVY